jgi:hypothetical protein
MNTSNRKHGYDQTDACYDGFICKVCGKFVPPSVTGSEHRNHCPYCLSSLHMDRYPATGLPTAAELWNRLPSGFAKTASGRLFTAAPLRASQLQPNCGGRQPGETDSIALRPLAQPPFPLEQIAKEEVPE